jgi:hypothetical protein
MLWNENVYKKMGVLHPGELSVPNDPAGEVEV